MKTFAIYILMIVSLVACTSNKQYKQDLLSGSPFKINRACFKLGERRDTSAVKLLLTKILDPGMTTNFRYKGMTVNYCRLVALKKISGIDMGRSIDQLGVDTAATLFYLDWAIEKGYIKNRNEVNIYYY